MYCLRMKFSVTMTINEELLTFRARMFPGVFDTIARPVVQGFKQHNSKQGACHLCHVVPEVVVDFNLHVTIAA